MVKNEETPQVVNVININKVEVLFLTQQQETCKSGEWWEAATSDTDPLK